MPVLTNNYEQTQDYAIAEMSDLAKPNLLINANFEKGIINQKGSSYYTNGDDPSLQMHEDRWIMQGAKAYSGKGVVGLTFGSNENESYAIQNIELKEKGTYHIFCEVKSLKGTVKVFLKKNPSGYYSDLKELTVGENNFTINMEQDFDSFQIMLEPNSEAEFLKIKLEVGKEYTGMPVWDATEELAKCKRYFRPLPTTFIGYAWGTDGWGYQNCPDIMDMAKTPTITLVKGSNDGQLKVMDNGSLKSYAVSTPEANIYGGYIRWKGLATRVNYGIIGFFNVDKIYADANTY